MSRDKYERTLWRVIDATESEQLHWEAVSPASCPDFVTNADKVVRAYDSELALRDTSFPLLFVEKKITLHDDYAEPYETLAFELYVLDQSRRMIFSIYDGLVDRDDLARLAAAVSDSSDAARHFFQALDEESR
jgi:hypothetical protein